MRRMASLQVLEVKRLLVNNSLGLPGVSSVLLEKESFLEVAYL